MTYPYCNAYGAYISGYGPPKPIKKFWYCLSCDCSQSTYTAEPCWQCGGETQEGKPNYWANLSSAQTVVGGGVYSPGDTDGPFVEDEGEAA